MSIKIFIACHKPCDVRHDDVYSPIHVGRAISRFQEEMSWMTPDDSGENISKKNPTYCEMTAQYWAWKNITNVDYIGFCHYRRFQKVDFSKENAEQIMAHCDVILNEPIFTLTPRLLELKNYLIIEDIFIMFKIVKKLFPDYYDDLLAYSNGHYSYIANMFVCRKSIFDEYASWIFTILAECEKYIKLGSYSRQKRIFGYIAEYLMPVFFLHNKMHIKTVPFVYGDNQVYSLRTINKLKNCLLNVVFKRKKFKEPYFDPSIELGLKNDGVEL